MIHVRKSALLSLILFLSAQVFAQTTERVYLSGEGPADAIEWDFYCSEGMRSGEWTKIPVPSNWEQHGFGGYDYGHVPPGQKHDEVGTYKTTFFAPESWKDKAVRLVFEGAMTETSVKVNGQAIGTPHMGGYLPFSYSLNSEHAYNNSCLKYGAENELEVVVAKKPSNTSLDLAERKADYWVFGGIYRPVYIEVQPTMFINRLAIDAKANGEIMVDVFPQSYRALKYYSIPEFPVDYVEAEVLDMDGNVVGDPFSAPIQGAAAKVRLTSSLSNPEVWSTETPNLYQLRVSLKKNGETIHEKTEPFGFRTFEVRPGDGLFLNGKKLKIKGVNRNVMHPTTARSVNAEDAWKDARMIKEMNANLVRSHMPATKYFMEACDQLGLLVITELTNWQKPYIDASIARDLVHSMISFYQNHPSVIIWANGNEGGFNVEVDELYKLYDIQERPIIHPWGVFDAIDALHYPNYADVVTKTQAYNIYFPTEFLHGLYDGGHGAGLEDYWKLMMDSPIVAGGVLWCWADAAVARTDKDGWLDTDGNHSADGIVGPNREKEASYFTIREIWSPVQVGPTKVNDAFTGAISLENHYLYTSLDQCSFEYQLMDFNTSSQNTEPIVLFKKEISGPDVQPGEQGGIKLDLPADWEERDALGLLARDPSGREIMEWSWALNDDQRAAKTSNDNPVLLEDGVIEFGNTKWIFDEKSGLLEDCQIEGESTGLKDGPVLYHSSGRETPDIDKGWEASFVQNGETIIVNAGNSKTGSAFSWTFATGEDVTFTYNFAAPTEPVSYCAVGFDLPEEAVLSKRWMGDGPFRIWANRLKGPQFGLWQNDYNDAIPGYRWTYPAFKGVFGDVDWMELNLEGAQTLTIDPVDKKHIGVLIPSNVVPGVNAPDDKKYGPIKATWDYPTEGGLFMFHKVPAVGSKFKNAEERGPQSEPEQVNEVKGTVRFILE